MKKILTMLVLVLLGACTKINYSVPLFIYDMSDPYMKDFEQKIRAVAMDDMSVTSFDASNSQIIQNEQIESSMKNNDVLIINPVDRLSVFSVIQKASLDETKLIFFNREPLSIDLNRYKYAYYVGADAKQSATLQAELIMDLFGPSNDLNENDLNQDNKIQVLILKGEQGHQDAEARTEYVVKTLEEAGYQIEVLDTEIANWDYDKAKTSTFDWFNVYEGIELIISNNDAMALGAIEALVELKVIDDINQDGIIDRDSEPWLPVVGIDGLDLAIESITNGYLYGTIMNDSQTMAEVIIELAEILINNGDLSQLSVPIVDNKYMWIDYQKLTLSND